MLDSIYIGLSGLSSFSRGLSTISGNVANLNTPGFKATDLLFEDLVYQQQDFGRRADQSPITLGSGVSTPTSITLFRQGDVQQTGNDLDAAINGLGFFVVRKDDQVYFTRRGQFQIDTDGYLVSQAGGQRVASLSGSTLADINVGAFKVNPGRATQQVNFTDNLSVNDGDNSQVANINVFDAAGGSHALKITFTNNSTVTPRSWLFKVEDGTTGALVTNSGEVRFQGDGSPAAGFNSFTFNYAPTNAPSQTITFKFGEPGSFAGATNFSAGTDSTLKAATQDGFSVGALTRTTISSAGALVFTYSNGKTVTGPQLALAQFSDLQSLKQIGGGLFQNPADLKPVYGLANTGAFGSIAGGSIEAANVDLAQEFSDLIVVQRGYQASSQVISTANDMMQVLFDLKSRK